MAKKIMVLNGSPHKDANTGTVAAWFAEGAIAAGAEIEMIHIAQLKSKFSGCIACMGCQKSDKYECQVEDDVKPVLARMSQADAVVFATPTYFFGPSAQTKSVVDRMYSQIKLNARGGYDINISHIKLGVIATAGGDVKPGLKLIDDTFRAMAGFSGISYDSLLVPFAPRDPVEMKTHGDVKEKAIAFGRAFAA
jgi:NAD(P)H-dependent FMN reductase